MRSWVILSLMKWLVQWQQLLKDVVKQFMVLVTSPSLVGGASELSSAQSEHCNRQFHYLFIYF